MEPESQTNNLQSTEPLLNSGSKNEPKSEEAVAWPKDKHEIVDKYADVHARQSSHPTTYTDTLIHLIKGNIGGGMFAMGDAFKNAGLLVGPLLTVFLGLVCLYSNHLLIRAAELMRKKKNLTFDPSFPETVELCFENGPKVFRKWSSFARISVIAFIIITQIGFCCVYFVFVSSTAHKVLESYGIINDIRVYMGIMLVPVLLSCYVRTLKFLMPISLMSNIVLLSGVALTLYISAKDLPPLSSRPLFASWQTLPLFFGTTIYSFEGISLVIPLKNSMADSKRFSTPFGVLNIGSSVILLILLSLGFIGYLKYGNNVKGSLTLNLPAGETFSEVVQIMVAIAIVLSFALQFFVAAELIWIELNESWGPFSRPVFAELSMRTVLVCITFFLAAVIPQLGLFISLVGAVSSTFLALIYPALCDIAIRTCPKEDEPLKTKDEALRFFIDGVTLTIGIVGLVLGTCTSLSEIIAHFSHGEL